MKHLLIFIFIFSAYSVGFAQTKEEKKLNKYFYKNQPDKGLGYLEKIKQKNLAHYKALLLLKKSELAKSASFQKKYTDQAIKSFPKDVQNKLNSDFRNYAIQQIVLVAKKTTKQSHFYNETLIKYFGDSTLYLPNFVVEAKPEIATNVRYFFQDSTVVNIDSLTFYATNLVGTPYKYGGTTTQGFDCSGFTQYLFNKFSVELPHNANMQSKLGEVIPLEKAKPGDMVFFGSGDRAYHAGMILKNEDNKTAIIHCVYSGVSIDEEKFETYWKPKVLCVKRILN